MGVWFTQCLIIRWNKLLQNWWKDEGSLVAETLKSPSVTSLLLQVCLNLITLIFFFSPHYEFEVFWLLFSCHVCFLFKARCAPNWKCTYVDDSKLKPPSVTIILFLLNQIKIDACLSSVGPFVNEVKLAAALSANPVSETQTINIIKSFLTEA